MKRLLADLDVQAYILYEKFEDGVCVDTERRFLANGRIRWVIVAYYRDGREMVLDHHFQWMTRRDILESQIYRHHFPSAQGALDFWNTYVLYHNGLEQL